MNTIYWIARTYVILGIIWALMITAPVAALGRLIARPGGGGLIQVSNPMPWRYVARMGLMAFLTWPRDAVVALFHLNSGMKAGVRISEDPASADEEFKKMGFKDKLDLR